MPDYDAVIIGAGHNGLVCATYLAKAGLKVKCVERNPVVGGAAVTEEFHPGFRNSVASYTVSLLNPKVIRDLELYKHGLRIVERRMSNFWPFEDGRSLAIGAHNSCAKAEFEKFSSRDAMACDKFYGDLARAADVVRYTLLETPPNAGGGALDMLRAGKLGWHLARLSLDDQRLMHDLFTKSIYDFASSYFESRQVLAAVCFDGIIGAYAGPNTPGTAYVLLHHALGEVNGKKGQWGHAIGGMGAISDAIAKAATAAGVDIQTGCGVSEVLVSGDTVVGVALEKGPAIRSPVVVGNLNLKLLYTKLINEADLPSEFLRRMRNWKCVSGVLRMNVALSELPDFTCKPGKEVEDHHTAGIVIGPSVEYLENAYLDAVTTGMSRQPIVEVVISSALDDTLAPESQHVASLFCQSFAPELPGNRSWDDERDTAADRAIDMVTCFAPNFRDSIIARQVLTPLDLERRFGLVGGDIFHGTLGLDQMFSARPMLGHADYRGPLKGLYHCGAGAHPGGGVTGAPGHNAAREILRDVKTLKKRLGLPARSVRAPGDK